MGEIGEINKDEAGRINIEKSKKAGTETILSINNSVNDNAKITNWHVGLVNFAVFALAIGYCVNNADIAISEKTLLRIITFTLDDFLAIFAILINTFLEKKAKVYEFNLFYLPLIINSN